MSSLNNRPPSYTPKTSPPSHTFARNIVGARVVARCTRLAVAMAQRMALTSRNPSSRANCAAFMQPMMVSKRKPDSRILLRAAQAHAHQFHYETGTRLLYWFGTQPILARRSPVHPLAKLLILSLFSEKIAHALAVILHGDWCARAHTM
jgi:hypothetical protein